MSGAVVAGAGRANRPPPSLSLLEAADRLRQIARELDALEPEPPADRLWAEHAALETAIMAAPISTPAEAVIVLTVATNDVFSALGFADSDDWATRSLAAVARATRFLAGVHEVELEGLDGMPRDALDRGGA